jgi:hypothetical protein
LAATLQSISNIVPVAIVTAKDYSFIQPRTPFADAWSCVYGSETVLSNGTRRTAKPFRDFSSALEIARGMPGRPTIEYKRTSTGELCGLCVEWQPDAAADTDLVFSNICKIRDAGLHVLYDPLYPMIDITSVPVDKGDAVRILLELLKVRGGMMFVGDSLADNSAFALADFSVGIMGSPWQYRLNCDYFVKPDRLGGFFDALLGNKMIFSETLPDVRRRRGPA